MGATFRSIRSCPLYPSHSQTLVVTVSWKKLHRSTLHSVSLYHQPFDALASTNLQNKDARKQVLVQFMGQLEAELPAFSPAHWMLLLARLTLLLLLSASKENIRLFLGHISSHDSFRALVSAGSQAYISLLPTDLQGTWSALLTFLESQHAATGSPRACDHQRNLDWLQENLWAFAAVAHCEDFIALLADFSGQALASLTDAQAWGATLGAIFPTLRGLFATSALQQQRMRSNTQQEQGVGHRWSAESIRTNHLPSGSKQLSLNLIPLNPEHCRLPETPARANLRLPARRTSAGLRARRGRECSPLRSSPRSLLCLLHQDSLTITSPANPGQKAWLCPAKGHKKHCYPLHAGAQILPPRTERNSLSQDRNNVPTFGSGTS
ncbi:uncharacterized protein [Apteryx mantelli]|uniref:Uncharacterized protein isoform X2 n=1 Tax=Apteryx mantelli TaxID=2696672 RepID=A0ABM4FBT8_9AVES